MITLPRDLYPLIVQDLQSAFAIRGTCRAGYSIFQDVLTRNPALLSCYLNKRVEERKKAEIDRFLTRCPQSSTSFTLQVTPGWHELSQVVEAITACFPHVSLQIKKKRDTAIAGLCTSVQRLKLQDSPFFEGLEPPRVLHAVDVRLSTIDRGGLTHLFTRCTQLQSLCVASCSQLTAEDFEAVAFPPTLRALVLAHCKVGIKGLQTILRNLPNLETLSLESCKTIDAQGFFEAPFPSTLRHIDVRFTKISSEGKKRLAVLCPGIAIRG